jgi:kynurenine formamidase
MGLSTMTYTLTTHTGTHLDAPYHYGWRSGNTGAMTVDGIPLEWCYGPGVYLDLSAARDRVESVSAGELIAAAERIGRPIAADDIVLIGTGMPADHVGSMRYFTRYRGISGEAVGYLLDRGVKVIGTDTFSFDPPFCDMLDAYCKSGDKRVLWPAHVLGRDRPYIQIERLGGLDALPAPCGFMVACFPIKLKNSDAAWARVAAIYHEQGMCS